MSVHQALQIAVEGKARIPCWTTTFRDRMKTDRGPIGVGSNSPRLDEGTSALTEHIPRVPTGQSDLDHRTVVAQAMPREQMDTGPDLLAAFDYKNAVIWLSEDSLNKLKGAFLARKVLKADDVQTLSHEFAHVWQNSEVFEKYADRARRAKALINQDTERISKMSEAQYIDFRLKAECQAEKVALIIVAELKKSKELESFADQDAETWIHNARSDYVDGRKGYRAHYQEIRAKLSRVQQPASAKPAEAVSTVAAEVIGKPDIKAEMKTVSSLIAVFPGQEKSATLFKLLELMKRYEVCVVVSQAFGSAAKQ